MLCVGVSLRDRGSAGRGYRAGLHEGFVFRGFMLTIKTSIKGVLVHVITTFKGHLEMWRVKGLQSFKQLLGSAFGEMLCKTSINKGMQNIGRNTAFIKPKDQISPYRCCICAHCPSAWLYIYTMSEVFEHIMCEHDV